MSTELLTHKQMFEKYKELRTKSFEYPYFYKLNKNGNTLYFVGAKHSNSPNDTQFKKVSDHWDDFITDTKNKKRLVLVEGGVTPIAQNEQEAIQKYAEPGFMTLLAKLENVQILSSEPPEELEINALLEKYNKETVAVYNFANIVSQWQRFELTENLDDYVSKYLGYLFNKPIWKGFDCSPTNLKLLYKKVLGREFDHKDKEFIFEFITPSDTNISGYSDDIRDKFLLEKIKELWETSSLFIVYGSGHAIRLETELHNHSNQVH